METTSGFLSRVAERVVSWVAFGLLIALGVAIWRMAPETRGAIWSGIWRTVAWVAIAAAVPWSARLVIRPILETGSNWAPVGLMTVLVAVDVIAGLVLLGGLPAGGWSWVAALAAVATAGTYNYLVAAYLADMAGG